MSDGEGGVPPEGEFYYLSEGRGRSWFELSEAERRDWKRRHENAKRRAGRILNEMKKNPRAPA